MRIFDADVTGSLHVSGSSQFRGDVTVSGSQTITGSLIVNGNTNIGDELTDNHNFTGSLLVRGSISGSLTGSLRTDYIDFNTGSVVTAGIGRMTWNDGDGTIDVGLKGGNVTLQLGQEEVVLVKNNSGLNLLESNYQVVRVEGAQGNRVRVNLSMADNDANSAETLGLVTETIAIGGEGFVTTSGLVRKINTTGALQGELWSEGDMLYLSPFIAGGITNVKPEAPNHMVIIGYVIRAHATVGSIFVKVNNGYEIDELHNVKINTGSLSYGDLLMRSGSVWANTKALSGSYQLTGSLDISGSQTINGNQIVSGSLTITNNITVLGTSSFVYVTSSNLNLTGPYIYTNVFEPIERFGGLVVFDSGSSTSTASLLWDSTNNHWIYQNASGSSYSGGMLLSGPRNTGSLGQEVSLTSTRIPKSVGGDHLDNSNIYDTGTVVKIISNSEITGSLKVTGGISGSIDYSYIQNTPSLVSGSAQIDITGTTGYNTVSGSIAAALSGSWVASDGISSDTISFGETVTIQSGANTLVNFFPGSNTFVVNSNHPSVTAAGSSNNSGRTYIQDILLDSFGHITGITTATETVVNTDIYTTGATFNTSDGVVTFTRNDGNTFTVDLDGRYGTSSSDNYVTGGTFNTSTGNLRLTRNDGGTIDTNLDGRYLTSHPSVSAASSSDNSGRTYIQDILLDSFGHITGITTATETVVDTYTTGGTTNSTTGLITFTKSDGGTYTTSISGYVSTQIANLVDSAPVTLDTLNELAAALGDDPNFATTIATAIGNKVSKSGDTMTGNLTAPAFIKSGGTSSQFLKADGSVDSNTYLTSFSETDTLATVTARGSSTATPVTFNSDVTLGNTADLKFVDLAGTFPTSGKGFDWTLNNDGARIYAIQPSSDSIDLVFQLRDNATTNDRFVFHVADYQGPAFDKYPLIIRGGTEFDLYNSSLYVAGTLVLSNGRVLQNVTGNISMFTNDSGYLTAHPSVTAASSSNNSGRTYIQDILLDSFGHITGITTATETVTDTNYYVTGATFNTGDGVITLTRNDGNTITVDIDGRFLTAHPSVSAATSSNNSGRTYIQDILLDSFGHITGITTATETVTDTNYYSTGATFNNGDGVITFTRNDGGTYTVDIDGRFLTSYTETDTLATVTARGNVTNQSITVSGVTSYNDVIISGGTLTVYESVSGATVFAVDGTNGRLFAVTDDLSNSLFSVNTISGLPVIEAFADYHIVMGRFNQNDFYLGTTGEIGMGTAPVSGYKLAVVGNIRATSFVKSGGTSSQFLKADGSVDTNTYLTSYNNYYTTGVTFNTGDGVLTFTRTDGGTYTVDLDGRYGSSSSDFYTTGATFNTGNGIITFTRNDGGTYTVDIDGKYAEASHNHDSDYVNVGGDTMTGQLNVHYTNGRISVGNGTDNILMGAWDGTNQRIESNTRPIYIVSYGGTVSLGRAGGNSLVIDTTTLTYGGSTVWTAGNDGASSGLDADLLDGQHGSYYYPASNPSGYISSYTDTNYYVTGATFNTGNGIITLTRNDGGTVTVDIDGKYSELGHTHDDRYLPYVKNTDTGGLTSGQWYTIAANPGNRASAKFILRDTSGGNHQSVVFYATHHYGNYSDITVLINSRYSGNPFRYIRIVDGSTYDGAMLQVYIDLPSSQVQAWMLENIQGTGWIIKDWIPDGVDPGDIPNFPAMTETPAQVDLDNAPQGGIIVTGPIYGGGDTTQYEYLNTNNYSTTTDTRYYTETEIGNFFSGASSISGYNKSNWDTAYGWGNHATQGYATTGYVQTQISNLIDSAPGTLDTLNELAAAINDDPNFYSTITGITNNKVSKSGDTMTGNLSFGATSGLGLTWGLNTDAAFIRFISTGNGAGQSYLEIGTQDDNDEEIKFSQSGTVRAYIATDGFFRNGGGYKYLYETGTWGIDISGNAATVTNGVYSNGSYSNPSWITALAGSKITGNISGNAYNITQYTINQNLGTTNSPTFDNVTTTGQFYTNTASSRYKYSVYDSSNVYQIGMENSITFGGLNAWGMTFQFSDNDDRGFWWGDNNHSTAQGAMALTTNGYLTVARGIRVGYGESDTATPNVPLQVYGSGSLVFDVQGSQGQLFSVTDSLSGSLFSVNDISGLPVLEVFSDDRVVMGSFGMNSLVVSGTTTTVSGSFAVSGSATINGGTVWHSNNDGSGSGLDADLLDGQHGSYYAVASSLSSYLPLSGGTVTGLLTINRNTAGLKLNRDSVGNYNGIYYSTANSDKWFVGMRENLSSNNHIHYSEALSADILTLNQTSGTATFYSSVTASSFVKSGGSSSQFLMADGSVSTNPGWITSYTDTNYYTTSASFNTSNGIITFSRNDGGTYTVDIDGKYLDASSYTASDVLSKLLTVDGSGSGLDADTLDGYHASSFLTSYSETDTLNSVTTRGASTTNNITIGAITVGGSLSYGSFTGASNYVTGADNILLKGNSVGVSGIFFESEKDGTNINHPSDFGFIQYHAYGIGGSSGESNRLVIGVSNDGDDVIVMNPVSSNGLVVRVGADTTEYTVYHAGNIPTWNQNTTGNAATATLASTVTINYNNDSNSTYQMLWGSGNSVYGTSQVYLNPATDYVYAAAFNATDWFRSTGSNGWYNATYGGGIYQTESTMVRTYDNRGFWIDGGNTNTVQDATLYVTATNNNDWLAQFNAYNSSKTEYGIYVNIAAGATYGYALRTDSSSFTYRVDGSGRVYAPIYYDINDTNYYVNPASTSNLGIVKLNSTASGTEVFTVDGVNGRLFTITDDLSSSLFSVNTIAGVPVIEAFADSSVIMGRYNQNDFIINSSGQVSLGRTASSGYKLSISGATSISDTSVLYNSSTPLLNVGGSGDGRIAVRHIWGKSATSASEDSLWLQYNNAGYHVQIGASGGGNNLYVSGNIYMGGYFGGNLVATQSWVTSQGYITSFNNYYTTSASFNTGNGVITFSRNDGGTYTVDIDGRFLTSYTETDTLDSVIGRGDNTTKTAVFYQTSNTFVNTVAPSNRGLSVFQDTAGADAYITFHVSGDYAGYFGLGGAENDLVWGGWSVGNVRYRIWHSGNDGASSGLDADLLDGQHGSYYYPASNPNGYITSYTDTNYYTTSASFDTSNGIITFSRTDGGTYTVDIDGKYAESSHTHDDRYFTETESDARFQPLENQRLSTGNSPTFNQIYANSWFRNNDANEGLYNETTTMHWSSGTNGYWDVSSTNAISSIRFYTGGHLASIRGYLYANSSNEIGFLNSGGNWGIRMDNSYNTQIYGALTVGSGTSSDIYMTDTDEGTRRIHNNSGRIGFLNTSNSWGSYSTADGSWRSDQAMYSPIYYDINDTNYYLNPNGTSNLKTVKVNSTVAGTEALTVDGVNGRLFTITDDMTDSIFSVNTISGLPVIEAFADYKVVMGRYNQNDFIINPSGQVSIGASAQASYKFTVIGGQWGSYFKGGDTGSGSDIARFVDNGGNTKLLVRGDGNSYFYGSVYINDNIIWHAGNDGSGSGLDADLLDGQHGSYYYPASNPNGYITSYTDTNYYTTSASFNTSNGIITFTRNDGGTYTVDIDGKYAEASSLGSYLPLAGGTMTGTITITNTDIRSNSTSNWTGDPGTQGKIQYHSNRWYIVSDSSSNRIVQFRRDSVDVSYIDNNGVFQGTASYASSAGNADTVDSLHASDFVRAYTTSAGDIDSDWGQSFKTFDPVPTGTPPLSSPNIRTINIGENFGRRTQMAFDYADDRAWFRRRQDTTWYTWREFIHSGNISSYALTSLPSHNHDDRYFTETESDARFQPLENQRLSTSNGPTFTQIYNNGWFRNNNTNEGLYNTATGNHWYSENNASFTLGSPNTSYGEIRMRQNHQGTYKGSFYWDSAGLGILNNQGGWSVRVNQGSGYGGTLYGSWNTTGDFLPNSNNSYNLGSSSLGWANIYTNDLHLSNMNKPEGNDIDGTSGTWTIQEGAENLYIINNLNGKKYRITLEEI